MGLWVYYLTVETVARQRKAVSSTEHFGTTGWQDSRDQPESDFNSIKYNRVFYKEIIHIYMNMI